MTQLIFTLEEDNLIRKLYPHRKKDELLSRIDKTWTQIVCRARYLKIKCGGSCIICGKRAVKQYCGLLVCNDCYYSKGGKCEVCGNSTSSRARFCLKCSRKIVGNKNRIHKIIKCEHCGSEISFLNKSKHCRKCSRRLHINKVKVICIECGKVFYISRYAFNIGKGKFCSPKCKNIYRSKNIHLFSQHKFPFIDKSGVKIMMRSTWEVIIAKYLENNNIFFEYERKFINTKVGKYWPDFYIPNFNLYIEVKGYLSNRAKEKIDDARQQGYHLLVFDKQVMKSFKLI